MSRTFAVSAMAAVLVPFVAAQYPYNHLAKTPQMGWDNWSNYPTKAIDVYTSYTLLQDALGCSVSEDLLLSTARIIVDVGLRDVGYEYVVLDDCWALHKRNSSGFLQYDPQKFPKGMSSVGDQIHSLNLKFGMYSSAGSNTCARYPGSLGYEKNDAASFAGWGVDLLKYDNCYNQGQAGIPAVTFARYEKMSVALKETGRDILYGLCNWGEDYPWKWAQTIANSWRMSGDIGDHFDQPRDSCPCTDDQGYNCALPGYSCSAMNILNKVAFFVDKAVPHAWNDLDALEVGNGGMNDEEYKTHFTMWAAVKSPLVMGNDLRVLKAKSLSILTNPAVIALNQDPLGSSVVRRWRFFVPDTDEYGQGEIQMWSGSLDNGDAVAILLNAGNDERVMNATLTDVFTDDNESASMSWDMYDLWANRMDDKTAQAVLDNGSTKGVKGIGTYYYNATAMSYAEGLKNEEPLLFGKKVGTVKGHGKIQANVPRHGVVAYRLRPAKGSSLRAEL